MRLGIDSSYCSLTELQDSSPTVLPVSCFFGRGAIILHAPSDKPWGRREMAVATKLLDLQRARRQPPAPEHDLFEIMATTGRCVG
jgi:hypothetical protein